MNYSGNKFWEKIINLNILIKEIVEFIYDGVRILERQGFLRTKIQENENNLEGQRTITQVLQIFSWFISLSISIMILPAKDFCKRLFNKNID